MSAIEEGNSEETDHRLQPLIYETLNTDFPFKMKYV